MILIQVQNVPFWSVLDCDVSTGDKKNNNSWERFHENKRVQLCLQTT